MADRRGGENSRWAFGLALFGEVVITGAVVAVLSVPVVTALPALAAGTAHLRRHLTGESVRVADLLRDFRAAWRVLWPAGLAAAGVALLLLWNLSLAQADVIPGSGGVLAVALLLLALLPVLMLRTAVVWRPERALPDLLREAADATRHDLAGSVLLLVACGMALMFVWMLPPLVLLTGGLLALAAVAVDLRARTRAAVHD
jgi:hypothetical protein